MASSDSAVDLFEPDRVSPSVGAEDTLQFLRDHGFFYQGHAEIGKLVDGLYRDNCATSPDAKLDYFSPALRADSRLAKILDKYPVSPTRFRFPWGTTLGYYNWDSSISPYKDTSLVAYMLGSGSCLVCRDGSLRIETDGKIDRNGAYRFEDAVLGIYPERRINMPEGGVVFVHTRLVHKPTNGRSIMLGLRQKLPNHELLSNDN